MTQTVEIAAELRFIVGQLVRHVRLVDALPPRLASALGYLDRAGTMNISALAARLRVRHQSMAATVNALQIAGYVERQPDPMDGRVVLLAITPQGRARLEEERTRRAGRLAELIAKRLSLDEQEQLATCLPLLERLIDSDDPPSEKIDSSGITS